MNAEHATTSLCYRQLRSQLAAGHIANLSDFWRDAESLNVPLVTPVDGAKDERDVTFLWRARHPLQGVYLRLNRVTDKEHVAKGMMTALPATDIWTLTLRLPASYCGSYSLVEIPPGTPAETIAQSGGRFATLVGHADPLNKTPGINVREAHRSRCWRLIKPRPVRMARRVTQRAIAYLGAHSPGIAPGSALSAGR